VEFEENICYFAGFYLFIYLFIWLILVICQMTQLSTTSIQGPPTKKENEKGPLNQKIKRVSF